MKMTFHMLRRTLISLTLLKHEPSNLYSFPHFPFHQSLNFISTTTSNPIDPNTNTNPEITKNLINCYQLSPKAASNAASVINQLKNYESSALIIDYLKQAGLSTTQLEELILRDPRFLTAGLDKTIKPRVRIIQDLGFSPDELAVLLSSVPTCLAATRSCFGSSILALKSLLGCNLEVIRLLKRSDWFLGNSVDKIVKPNFKFLESCGVDSLQIRGFLFLFPRFFLNKTEYLRDCVKKVDDMGLSRNSKMFIYGIRVVGSINPEKWESKLQLFRSVGYSENDILSVFRRVPQVFSISEEKIREVTNLLLSARNVDIAVVVQHPELLIYSAKRIQPRLQIIHILQSQSLIKKDLKLTYLLRMEDDKFVQKFVLPYTCELGEAGEKFMASRGSVVCTASV